ncbi:MAG: glycosyltransferase family 4 protein [Chitinophagaceae bacterium]|nr:glycosyltransferase family 4 protein [Chitinophagaceae bacterium]
MADRYFDLPPKQVTRQANKLHLVAVGALKELKNFEYLLEIFAYLTDQEIYLDIYGDGDKVKCETIIENKTLKIRMMGRIDDMATVIQQYDLLLCHQNLKGFHCLFLEAMAAGLPLLLSDIAPLTIVKDNAIYFQLDNAQATAGQITAIYQNEINIQEMAVQAKVYAEKTVRRDIYIKRLLDIYDQITQ